MGWTSHASWLFASVVAGLSLGALTHVRAQDGEDAGVPQTEASALRGLLASPGFEGAPMKGVYFFPGEGSQSNADLYTTHPSSSDDLRWNSLPATRTQVLDRIAATHANTVIASYWGDDMTQWSPMALDESSVRGVLEAAAGKPLVVVPALESGFDPFSPETPHFRFADDFPYAGGVYDSAHLAPRVIARLQQLVALFAQHPDVWALAYDRSGQPRHVVYILGAYAHGVPQVLGQPPGELIGAAFDALARTVERSTGVRIGFTLDLGFGEVGTFPFTPDSVGAGLAQAESVLAIQLYMSEMRSGRVKASGPFQPPVDNNEGNLESMLDGKLRLLDGWRAAGLPVIYDVSPGFDGRYVWAVYGTCFWGDNADYTSDDWRNLQSENKRHDYIGITFNTWNGYTEGYSAVPSVEHGEVIYDWLGDLYAPDARACHHVEYLDGKPAYRVTGAICEKWQALLGRRGALGDPMSSELPLERASVVRFLHGSIYATADHGVREIHGAIHDEYERLGYERSCLGLPIADEEDAPNGRRSRFEHGAITFSFGDRKARARCSAD